MSDKPETSVPSTETTPAGAHRDPRRHSAARRKAILKGLGKTAAIAGAAAPLSSLAGARLRFDKAGQNMHCSVSGQMSVLMSGAVTSIPVCMGLLPSKYRYVNGGGNPTAWNGQQNNIAKANWPEWPGTTNAFVTGINGTAFTPAATFAQVFGSGSSTKIGLLVEGQGLADEAQWVAALLNAQRFPAKFPHTNAEVIAQYGDVSRRASALALYQTYVNKYTSVV